MSNGTLIAHCGARMVTEEELIALPPARNKTETHVAIDHDHFLNVVSSELRKRGIKRTEGQYAMTPDHECMFGLIPLEEFSIPTVDARNQMFAETFLPPNDRHSVLVRMVKKGALPASQILNVEEEYLKPQEEALRDRFSDKHSVWRFLQAYTHNLRTEGKFRTFNSRLEAINQRTQIASDMLFKYSDPDGSRVQRWLKGGDLFPNESAIAKSYRYVLGVRNSNNMRFPAGLVIGIAPFVCDNLLFSGEVTVARRHTKNILTDLPARIQTKLDRLLACGMIHN